MKIHTMAKEVANLVTWTDLKRFHIGEDNVGESLKHEFFFDSVKFSFKVTTFVSAILLKRKTLAEVSDAKAFIIECLRSAELVHATFKHLVVRMILEDTVRFQTKIHVEVICDNDELYNELQDVCNKDKAVKKSKPLEFNKRQQLNDDFFIDDKGVVWPVADIINVFKSDGKITATVEAPEIIPDTGVIIGYIVKMLNISDEEYQRVVGKKNA